MGLVTASETVLILNCQPLSNIIYGISYNLLYIFVQLPCCCLLLVLTVLFSLSSSSPLCSELPLVPNNKQNLKLKFENTKELFKGALSRRFCCVLVKIY